MTTKTAQIADHSFLQPVTHCERAFYHEYIERLEPAEGAPPLEAGSAMHEALEVLYGEGFDAVERAVEVLRERYDRKPHGYWSYLTANHLEVVLRNYVDFYRERCPWRVVQQIEEPLVAEAGTMLPFAFGGIPDLIVEDPQRDGKSLIVDHKTTSGWFGHKATMTRHQKQGPLYVDLARRVLGFEGDTIVFNVIAVKEKASEPGFSGQRFERMEYSYTEAQLEEARSWAVEAKKRTEWLELEVQESGEAGAPQNPGKHCKYCTYEPLCSARNATLRESAKRTKFQVRERLGGRLLSGADSHE